MWDCVIVGGGAAGLTAATYLGRFQRDVLLIDSGHSRLKRIPITRNTPGFPNGVSGPDLLSRLQDQASRYGALFRAGEVKALEQGAGRFWVRVGLETISTRTVLLATGAKLREPPIDRLDEGLRGGLIRYCPICDAYEARGQNIAVLGARAGGVAEAHFLRSYSDTVSYLHTPEGTPTEAEHSAAKDAGIVVEPRVVSRISLEDKVIASFDDGATQVFDVLYPAFGCSPRSMLALSVGAVCAEEGGVIVDAHQRTNVPGLYAAGDVLQGLDQIASACGQAAIAAVAIHNALRELDAPALA